MRTIPAEKIKNAVAQLCILANLELRKDILAKLKAGRLKEQNKQAKNILDAIMQNALIAHKEKIAICQDTGLPCVFVEIGQDVHIAGDLKVAITKGVELGYKKGFLRNSVVKNPLLRDAPAYTSPVVHIDIVKGDKCKLTVLPKGFGCENKTQLRMFKPTAELSEIKNFIIGVVKNAGPDACPPYIVGVGIGGTADYAVYLAKKALLRRLDRRPSTVDRRLDKLERELLKDINKLNIGPMGLGGEITCLGVNIKTYPTHIAGLPVAVNISCHALRSAATVL